MPSLPSESFQKVRLGLSVVVMMAILAVVVFLFSGVGESRYQNEMSLGPVSTEWIMDGGVEVRMGEGEWGMLNADQVLDEGISLRTGASSTLGLLFSDADLIRLNPGTEIVVGRFDPLVSPAMVSIELVSGSIWVSDLQGVADIQVDIPRAQVEPEMASVFVRLNDDSADVFAAHHPSRINFLNNSGELLNNYLLTESYKVALPQSKITETLSQLRYTKLTKEFPFIFVKEKEWEEGWSSALSSDLNRLNDAYIAFLSDLRRAGDGGAEVGSLRDRLNNAYRLFRSWLTLDRSYLESVESEDELSLLHQALYLILHGEDSAAQERLSRFVPAVSTFDSFERIAALVQIFRAVEWGSDFYGVKELLRELEYESTALDDRLAFRLDVQRERLNEIYDLLDQGERGAAQEALLEYSDEWADVIDRAGLQLGDQVQRITEERQMLQNLLYREDTFYSRPSYEVLTQLEDRILSLTAEEYDLNEERQQFIQDKIRMMTRLVYLVDIGLVGPEEGHLLGQRLVKESRELLDRVTSRAAITSYFVSRVDELEWKFAFVGSPEFLLGEGSFDDRLADYREKQQDLSDLSSYIAGLRDQPVVDSGIPLDEALAKAEQALQREGIQFSVLTPLGDVNHRLFRIEQGRSGLNDFTGNYDRETDLIYDLEVNGEVFSAGVLLGNLVEAIEVAISTEAFVDEMIDVDLPGPERLSPVEELAIDLARTEFKELSDVEVRFDDVSIVDLESNIFSMHLEFEAMEGMFAIDFNYDVDEGQMTDVVGQLEGELFVVDDVRLDSIEADVKAAWDRHQAEEIIEAPQN